MKILIDESLPRQLKQMLSEYETATVQEMGWAGIKNGELVKKAEFDFDVLLTADKNLRYQQNLRGIRLAIVVFSSNRLGVVQREAEELKRVLPDIRSGQIIEL